MDMQFKKIEIKEDGNWIQRKLKNPHFKKTLIYISIGAVTGFLFFYITEGTQMDAVPTKDIIQNVLSGAFLVFFITNSPCARRRCQK